MDGILITSLENGFMVKNGSISKRVYPTLEAALCSVLDSLESFGGYTDVKHEIVVTPKAQKKRDQFSHTKNLNADIEKVDNGFYLITYFEPWNNQGESCKSGPTKNNRKDYGFIESSDLIKQVFRSYDHSRLCRCKLTAKKEITSYTTVPGGTKTDKRSEVILEDYEEYKPTTKRADV
jgi:hypothetical protein